MKFITTLLTVLFLSMSWTEAQTPVVITLKNGKTIDVHHFGQLNCNGVRYQRSYIIVKGDYNGVSTELKDYSKIASMELQGFTKPPVVSVGNEKGKITFIRKDGVTVTLDNAELLLSCYGAGDKYNQIKVQLINPLTDKLIETTVDVKDIKMINFK